MFIRVDKAVASAMINKTRLVLQIPLQLATQLWQSEQTEGMIVR
jgi:hypothetical protein